MSTEFFNDQWRIPSNENQNKVSNYSMEFDGTNYVQIGPPPNNTFLQPSEAELNATGYSVSAWIKIDSSFASTGGIFANDGIPQTGRAYGLEFYIGSTRKPAMRKGDGTGRFTADVRAAASAETVPVDAWTHVAFVLPSATNTTWQIYINGVASTMTTAGSGGAVGYSPNYSGGIGRYRFEYFQGQIDQVTIFDYELSQDQVTQLHNPGYAFNFIPNDYIDANTTVASNLDFSVSAWINPTSHDTVILGTRGLASAGDSNGITMNINSSGNLWARIFTETSNVFNLQTGSTISLNNWSHVAMTYNSSTKTLKSYLNGTEAGSMVGADPSVTSTAELDIGRASIGTFYDYFDGEISNTAIFNTELTPTQLQTIYNNGKPLVDMSSFTSLQGWWKLDETATFNSGTSVWSIPDDSSNSNTGTSVGMNASNLVASNINGELIANPMITSPKPIAYYQLGDQSVYNGANYLVPNNSLSNYVFNFGATNESINLGNSFNYPSVVADPWTISFWVKPTNATSTGIIFSGYSAANNRGFYVYARSWPNPTPGDRRLQCLIRSNSSVYSSVVTPSLALNEWTHVAVCYGGGGSASFPHSFTVYFNNSPVSLVVAGGNTGTPAGSVGPNDSKHIGQRGDGVQYLKNAELSELSFLKYKLSASQVDTLYNNGAPGDISSLNPFTLYELNNSEIFNSTSTEWSVDNNTYPSVYKSSLNFNGSSDYIDCGTGSVFNLNQVTISAWINDNQTTNYGTVAGVRKSSDNTVPYMLIKLTAASKIIRFRATQSDGTDVQINSNPIIEANTWYHVVGVADGSNIKMYVNGELQTATNSYDGTLATPDSDFEIGKYPTAPTLPASYHWYGQISNVAVFNTGLSQSQVTTLYNNGTPEVSISHSPFSWWKLDNTTTGIQDSAGSNNGTNNGATEYAGFVNSLAGESVGMDSSNLVVSDLQQTSGYSPYALDFDGINDSLNCGNNSSLQITGAMTISYWIKGTSTNGAAGVGTLIDANNPGYLLGPSTTGAISFNIGLTSSTLLNTSTTQQITTTEWHHIVGVYTPSVSLKIYIDGQLSKNETSNIPSSQYAGGNDFIIGYRPCCKIDGQISNVAVWNTDLTDPQVAEVYNQGAPSNLHNFSGTAPVSWWQLGSNSSFNPNPTGTEGTWTCLDEIGTNNAIGSANMTNDDIVDGPGYSASGLGASSIDIKGDAPYSTANGLSENMDVLDRTTDVPS